MKSFRIMGAGALALILTVASASVWAQTAPTPDVAKALISRTAVSDWTVFGTGQNQGFIRDAAAPRRSALRIEIAEPAAGANPWDVTASILSTRDIKKGDRVIAAFWARTDGQPGKFSARLQGEDAPYTGLGGADLTADASWRFYIVEGDAPQDFPAGRAGLVLMMNTAKQTLVLGRAFLLDNLARRDGLEAALQAVPAGEAEDFVVEVAPGIRLAATLRTPPGKGPFPALMEITGSGSLGRNKDEAVSLALLDHGVAVLQYDKRGMTPTLRGDSPAASATLTQLISDAGALERWLRERPEVDSRRAGVLGASQGGLIAAAIAAKDPSIRFVVSLAGPAAPMSEIALRQDEFSLQNQGQSPAQIAENLKILRAVIAGMRAAQTDDDAAVTVKAALAPYVASGPLPQAVADQLARDAPETRSQMVYDPAGDLRQTRAPFLALFGSLDHYVPPDDNVPAFRAGLAADKDVTIIVLPGYNHVFQPHAKTGTVEEWTQSKEPMAADPAFLKIITDWVALHTK